MVKTMKHLLVLRFMRLKMVLIGTVMRCIWVVTGAKLKLRVLRVIRTMKLLSNACRILTSKFRQIELRIIKITILSNHLEDSCSFSKMTFKTPMEKRKILVVILIQTSMEMMEGMKEMSQLTWICRSLRGTSTLTATSREWASMRVTKTICKGRVAELAIEMTGMARKVEDIDE